MASPTPTLHFRVASPDDLPLVHPLVESAYRGDESRLGWTTEADLLSGKRIDTAGLLAKINAPNGAVLLATTTAATATTTTSGDSFIPDENAAAVIVACCEIVRSTPQSAYFGMFAVSPRRQRAGIGRQVLAYAEDHCRRVWGVERLELTVIRSRTKLMEWYMRRGYRRTGLIKPFPLGELERQGGEALVEDLDLEVLEKDLRAVDATR